MKIAHYEQMMDYLTGPRERFRSGGIAKPKRGLVDEPGSYSQELGQKYLSRKRDGYRVVAKKGKEEVYKFFPKDKLEEAKAYAKSVEERFDKIEAPQRVTGKKLTVYNKFARDISDGAKDFKDLTTDEKNIVKTRYKQTGGTFRKTFQTDMLSDLNQQRIEKAFPDVTFEFKKGQKLGVPAKIKGKRNPEFTAVYNFVNNNYKMSVKKSLPVSTQRDIVANFELPKGLKEWNFDVQRGGHLYGIPDTGGKNLNLGARIKNFVAEPKPYKLAADFGNPEGWLLMQMNRAYETKQNPNFIPKRDLVNGKKKIVGFTDNQYGGGKTYYALKRYADKFNGTMMTEHPDFKNTKKYIDIANKVKLAPNKVIKDLLIRGGVTDDRVTLNNLLQYMINKKGVQPTKRALVLHHKGGILNPTRDFQILNATINNNIKSVESVMRADPKNITPKNIKFLKDAGASITIDGKTYGGGPKTATGGFRQAEQFVQKKLEGFGDKDFKNLNKYLAAVGCVDRLPSQAGGAPTQECIRRGAEKINTGNIKPGAEARNASKFLNGAYKFGRGVLKFGVVPEALFVTGDSLLRIGMGDTLDEAFLRATDYLRTGDQTLEADANKISRIFDKKSADLFKDVSNFRTKQENFKGAKVNLEVDIAQNNPSLTGLTDQQVREIGENKIKKAQDELFMAQVPKEQEVLSDYKFDQAYDASKAQSFFTGQKLKGRQMGQIEDDPLQIDLDFIQQKQSPFFDVRSILTQTPDSIFEQVKKTYETGGYGQVGLEDSVQQAQKDYQDTLQNFFNIKNAPLSALAASPMIGAEQIYGANPENFLQKQLPSGASFDPRLAYDFAGGGIAKLAGKSSGPPPESGPTPQGLDFLLNRGRKR